MVLKYGKSQANRDELVTLPPGGEGIGGGVSEEQMGAELWSSTFSLNNL